MSLFKAQAHMAELEQRLRLQMLNVTFQLGYDTNYMPILVVVNNGETEFIKIEVDADLASTRVDALGLNQQVYSPHKVIIVRSTTIVDIPTSERLVAACAKLGMKQDIYTYAGSLTGSTPASFDNTLASYSLVVEFRSDEINPLTDSQ